MNDPFAEMTNHCQIGSSSNNNQPSSSSIFLTVVSPTILSHHPITCNAIFSAKAFIHGGMRLEIHFTHLRHSPLTPPPSSFCLAASACPHHVPPATTMYPPDALPASSYPTMSLPRLQIHFLHIRAPIIVLTVGCTILILYFLALEFSFVIPSTCTFLQGTSKRCIDCPSQTSLCLDFSQGCLPHFYKRCIFTFSATASNAGSMLNVKLIKVQLCRSFQLQSLPKKVSWGQRVAYFGSWLYITALSLNQQRLLLDNGTLIGSYGSQIWRNHIMGTENALTLCTCLLTYNDDDDPSAAATLQFNVRQVASNGPTWTHQPHWPSLFWEQKTRNKTKQAHNTSGQLHREARCVFSVFYTTEVLNFCLLSMIIGQCLNRKTLIKKWMLSKIIALCPTEKVA